MQALWPKVQANAVDWNQSRIQRAQTLNNKTRLTERSLRPGGSQARAQNNITSPVKARNYEQDYDQVLLVLRTLQSQVLDQVFRSGYWARKWIIQEIILARTVVLVLGNSVFAMQELENIFAVLEGIERHWPSTSTSASALHSLPIARLAAHRRNKRQAAPYPRMLHEMLPMYADNQCSDYLDHVYALYNLMGDHRKHLEIRYGQPVLAWCEQILDFLSRYEPAAKNDMLSHALLLLRLSEQHELHDLQLAIHKSETYVTTIAFERGTVKRLEECARSIALREHVKSLHPGLKCILRKKDDCWHVEQKAIGALGLVSKRVLSYFQLHNGRRSSGKPVYGLAAARVEDGDRIWQFLDMPLALIVRLDSPAEDGSPQRARVVGRCYLFDCDDTKLEQEPSASMLQSKQSPPAEQGLPSSVISLSIPDLCILAYCVTDSQYPRTESSSKSTEFAKQYASSVASFSETLYSPRQSMIS